MQACLLSYLNCRFLYFVTISQNFLFDHFARYKLASMLPVKVLVCLRYSGILFYLPHLPTTPYLPHICFQSLQPHMANIGMWIMDAIAVIEIVIRKSGVLSMCWRAKMTRQIEAALGTSRLSAVSDRPDLAWQIPTSSLLRLLANCLVNHTSAWLIIGSCLSLVHLASRHRLSFWVIWFYDWQRSTTKMQTYSRRFRVLEGIPIGVCEMQEHEQDMMSAGLAWNQKLQISLKLPVRVREQC